MRALGAVCGLSSRRTRGILVPRPENQTASCALESRFLTLDTGNSLALGAKVKSSCLRESQQNGEGSLFFISW